VSNDVRDCDEQRDVAGSIGIASISTGSTPMVISFRLALGLAGGVSRLGDVVTVRARPTTIDVCVLRIVVRVDKHD
jgi:hypothetical protein